MAVAKVEKWLVWWLRLCGEGRPRARLSEAPFDTFLEKKVGVGGTECPLFEFQCAFNFTKVRATGYYYRCYEHWASPTSSQTQLQECFLRTTWPVVR